jgi:sRNA-binding regulator protein Hfq
MEGGSSTSSDRPPVVLLHTAELIKHRDERKTLQFTLIGGESLEGVIRWFDEEAIHLVGPERTEVTVFKRAIAYYRVR